MPGSLADLLDGAAAGRYPPADGTVTVMAQPSPRDAGVLALTAPGNAASVRAFLAVGYRPVGAEVLFHAR